MLRIAAWFMMFVVNGGDSLEPTDRLIPPGYKGNPWGPAANAAREAGELPPIEMTPKMKEWDQWGRTVLKDGDIIFRRGDARLLFGRYPFSKFLANVTASPYSHVGTVVFEGGVPCVYDTTKLGVRRQPFAIWILDNSGPMGIKRLKPTLRDRVPRVVAYLRKVYEEQAPFDYNLGLDDRELYCVEMCEKAFRAADLKLSDPVQIQHFARFREFPVNVIVLKNLSRILLDEPLRPDTAVFIPGNDRQGIWSSPLLVTVWPTTNGGATSAAANVR